ncbi:MAG TPA: methyl-accepting chemotaxis protein [Azospirillum sp.]|nr:methyl-accepting chemotaxis protein [Azospirillum sp.]
MNLTVAQKLASAFGLIVLLALVPVAYQFQQFDIAFNTARAVATYDVAVADALKNVGLVQATIRNRRETALAEAAIGTAQQRPYDVAELHRQYDELNARIYAELAELQRLTAGRVEGASSAERSRYWNELNAFARSVEGDYRRAQTEGEALFRLLEQGNVTGAIERRSRIEAMRAGLDKRIDEANETLRRLTQAGERRIQEAYDEMVRSALVAAVLLLAASLVIAYLFGRSFTGRLVRAIDAVRVIGRGDLTRRVEIPGTDELGALGTDLNDMAERLRNVAQGTRAAAENVHAATAQIRASTQQQAASVAEQLAAVEETMATLSEITASGAQISRRAQEVASGAQNTAASSATGLKAVDDTMQAMDGIREQAETVAETIVMLSERTQAISDIIATVNDIAERSHLLALNAAIEAAAAGEHGRTFSVVATEIKNLADQAKDATAQVRSNLSDIQQGINASVMLTEEAVKRVTAGRRQADSTQATIRTMADNIHESVLAFQQIVAGTNQQQIGLEQVIQALQNIRQASTQTATGTRQLEGAAANLNDLGQGLVDVVRNYRV